MINLKNLGYQIPVLLNENTSQKIYIEKTFFKALETDQYFIKLYEKNSRGDFVHQGYLYFGLDFFKKTSWFIGIYIKPEFRNRGLSTLLLSFWIQLCLANNIYDLATISNQRKPFLIYILKRYAFELKNLNQYLNSGSNIHICRNYDYLTDVNKYLLFENPDEKSSFLESSICREDNYHVLDILPPDFTMIDTVLLRTPYFLQDESKAYRLSLSKFNQFRK